MNRLDSQKSLWNADLYACAYRVVERGGQSNLDLWQYSLSIGVELPRLPLCLRGGLCLEVNLDTSYERTCREHRININNN